MTDPTDETRPDREAWLEGYGWALSHLTDPGVLADARRLALAHETAETAQEAFCGCASTERDRQGARTPPVAPSLLPARDTGRCGCGEPGTTSGQHDDHAVIQSDLREIVRVLGLGTHARPYSSHEVVQREVLPALRALFATITAPTACTCTILSGSTPWQPAEWEQAEDCPVHPMATPAPTESDRG